MSVLDVIEAELNKIAEATGHVSYAEFIENEEANRQADAAKKVAA
ncbi:hypothetical protein [Vibrio harveyi]